MLEHVAQSIDGAGKRHVLQMKAGGLLTCKWNIIIKQNASRGSPQPQGMSPDILSDILCDILCSQLASRSAD